ncbi:uncharacterized protein LOC135155973 [Lytechinus pictus]|uniref:uncharacterized protein LOC135155973 n=1 Tax=Lytechinus pictus TaxID=7653 RepID=UPI0030B9DFB6
MAALDTLKVFISCVSFLFCFPISIKGEVVHITVLTVGYTAIETSSNVEYQCYRSEPDEDATLSFGRSAPITTDTPPPSATIHPSDGDVLLVKFSDHGDTWHTAGFGPFYCEAAKDARDVTRVTTFFQRSDAKFIPSGGVFTKAVNVNDTGVVISMTNRDQPDDNGNVITWRKDGGDVLTQFEGQTSINFSNPIDISDQGIYEIYYHGERYQNRGGIYRLIVRECPAGRWGPPECYGICDNCYNGGVCDDKSGLCICPNNFMGDNCLNICSNTHGNRFGLECEYRCSYRDDNVPYCRGNLFCLPNPYGCSCDVGSRGLACDSDCDAGTYGPGCSQTCHCADVSSCNSFSGICTTGGCQSGWSGNNCQILDICEAGYFGSNCTDKCHCMGDVSCDKTTGECPQKCALGYSMHDGQENCQGSTMATVLRIQLPGFNWSVQYSNHARLIPYCNTVCSALQPRLFSTGNYVWFFDHMYGSFCSQALTTTPIGSALLVVFLLSAPDLRPSASDQQPSASDQPVCSGPPAVYSRLRTVRLQTNQTTKRASPGIVSCWRAKDPTHKEI